MSLHTIKSRIGLELRAVRVFMWQTILAAFGFATVPLKHRHVFTRHGHLRLRYIAFVLVGFLGFVSSFSDQTDTPAYLSASDYAAQDIIALPEVEQPQAIEPVLAEADDPATLDVDGVPDMPTRKPLAAPAQNWARNIMIQTGDTVPSLLEMAGYKKSEAKEGASVLENYFSTKDLVAGGSMQVNFARNTQGDAIIDSVAFPESDLASIVLRQTANGFVASKMVKQLQREMRAVRVTIKTALYNDLSKAGVPHSMIIELIKAYSYSVDFARDIWANDTVEVLYDVDKTADNKFVKGNNLLLVRLTLRGKVNEIVRYVGKNGQVEFYDGKGKTIRRAFLQTPVDGARITSGFGMRHHPILGYSKMHKGVDFGAPTGTPIFAAGDGTIARLGWAGGYGNFIKISHNGTYATAYGHMSRFAKGLRTGSRVRQGQVIGYVGTTGRSTGPHLHFELIKNGQQVNPREVANVNLNNGLGGKDLQSFNAQRTSYMNKFRSLLNGAGIAAAMPDDPVMSTVSEPVDTTHPTPTRKPTR